MRGFFRHPVASQQSRVHCLRALSVTGMRYVCDAPGGKTWFQIETEAEAAQESDLMSHTVAKYFRQAHERATASYAPRPGPYIEQDIGLKAHIQRVMPVFLTLRDAEGT